jgi:hypothetical protein
MMVCPKCKHGLLDFDRAELFYCESKGSALMKFTLHSDASMSEEAVQGSMDADDDTHPELTITLRLCCGACQESRTRELELWSPYW